MRRFALIAIRVYQRYISPYKGFRCAYRAHTGCASCSALGYRAVRRHGVWGGMALLRARMRRCGVAHRRYTPTPQHRPFQSQRGECDVGGCDVPGDCSIELPSSDRLSCLDFSDCCDCDWPDRKKKQSDEEDDEYIPPQRQRRA